METGGIEKHGRIRGRLYGRRKGKALRPHQARLIEELLPRLSLDLTTTERDLAALFGQPVTDVWLEIGFGGGEHLLRAAAEKPEIGFIGCEPFVNGMAKALASIEAQRLANIRLYAGDAADLIGRLPGASLGRVFLFFPDPWPKRRQR